MIPYSENAMVQSCLTGGTMVKLIHGNVGKMGSDTDLDLRDAKSHSLIS